MAGDIDEEYYLVKRIDARYIREQEFYPDGQLKRDYTLKEPVKQDVGYPQVAELMFVVMAIAFVVLSIAILTAKPSTSQGSSKLEFNDHGNRKNHIHIKHNV